MSRDTIDAKPESEPTEGDESGEWEDVPASEETNVTEQTARPSSAASGTPRATRRRRVAHKLAAGPQPARRSATPRVREATPAIIDQEQIHESLQQGAAYTARYALSVVRTALRLLRPALGVLLFLYILAFCFGQVTNSVRTVVAPFCWIPGISRSPICYTPSPQDALWKPQWANYSQLVEIQSVTFEQLLEESASSSGLSLDIKKAQLATSDLVTLVRVSDLKSKDLLADALSAFVEDAKLTGRGLQRLSAKIGGAVDSIVAVNDYAMHTIEAANDKSSHALLSRIWPFAPHSHEVVLQTFSDSMSVLASQTERTILEAELILSQLERLEEHLLAVKETIAREDAAATKEHEELLAQLWTKLGGNQAEQRGHRRTFALLRDIGTYRKRALAHVVGALHTLRMLSADMEELRNRAAAPQIVGERIPVEVHMRSIRAGIDRLREGQKKAREREALVTRQILGIESTVLN